MIGDAARVEDEAICLSEIVSRPPSRDIFPCGLTYSASCSFTTKSTFSAFLLDTILNVISCLGSRVWFLYRFVWYLEVAI